MKKLRNFHFLLNGMKWKKKFRKGSYLILCRGAPVRQTGRIREAGFEAMCAKGAEGDRAGTVETAEGPKGHVGSD